MDAVRSAGAEELGLYQGEKLPPPRSDDDLFNATASPRGVRDAC
jgi:hypothetical protein